MCNSVRIKHWGTLFESITFVLDLYDVHSVEPGGIKKSLGGDLLCLCGRLFDAKWETAREYFSQNFMVCNGRKEYSAKLEGILLDCFSEDRINGGASVV